MTKGAGCHMMNRQECGKDLHSFKRLGDFQLWRLSVRALDILSTPQLHCLFICG